MSNHFRRELIISAVIIAGSLAIFAVGFYFFSLDLSAQSNKILAGKALLFAKTTELEALADLKKNSAQADAYQQAMDKLLVVGDQLLDFPRWLDGLSRARQLTFSFSFVGAQVQPQEAYPGYINFNLGASGSRENLLAFLKDIESRNQRFLVSLDTIDFSGDAGSYGLSSQGRVFFK